MATELTYGSYTGSELERRRQIWKAVINCVAEDGIAGATIRKVAERAGVSTGMVTYYYPNKKELITATFAAATDHFYEKVSAASGNHFGPERLEAINKSLIDSSDPEVPPASFWLEFWAEAARDPDLKRLYLESHLRTREYVVRSIKAGIDSGAYRDDVDPYLVADALSALWQGLRNKRELTSEITTPDRALEISRLMLRFLEK